MIGHRLHHRLATALVAALCLLTLAGCQGLAAGANGGGNVGVRNGDITFGNVPVGGSLSVADSIVNHSSALVTISSIEGLGSGFQVTGIALPLVLAAGQVVSFNVEFQPTAPGSPTATISFLGQSGQAYVALSASATAVSVGELAPNPSPVGFPNTNVGGNQTAAVALTNRGGTDLTITQATLSGAGFALGNLALPITLHAGASAPATITFAPTGSGTFSGSVAFATTANAQQNKVVISIMGKGVPPGVLTPNPSSFVFGNVQVGSSSTQTETLTNTGGAPVTVSQAAASGTGFSISGLALPITLNSGQSASFSVLFTPTTAGAATGNVNIVSNDSNPNLSIPLSGTGVAQAGTLAPNPSSLAFGSVQVGNSTNLSETLTNTGSSTVTISQANASGSGFSITGLTLPLNLAANQSITFTATFAPTGSGSTSGNLSIVSNAKNSPLNIALSGTGGAAGTLTVSPGSLSFGNVNIGSSKALTGSLNASGSAVNVTSASLNNNEFAVSGISLPLTLAVGQSAAFTITFTPQASGATSGSLSFGSNAANSPTVQSMTGTGIAAAQHTVDLTWNGSNGAVGYNIYRGTVSGGPYSMVNSSLDGSTSYTDSSVTSGDTYYYVATAVDDNANESGYSNETQAVIPNP